MLDHLDTLFNGLRPTILELLISHMSHEIPVELVPATAGNVQASAPLPVPPIPGIQKSEEINSVNSPVQAKHTLRFWLVFVALCFLILLSALDLVNSVTRSQKK